MRQDVSTTGNRRETLRQSPKHRSLQSRTPWTSKATRCLIICALPLASGVMGAVTLVEGDNQQQDKAPTSGDLMHNLALLSDRVADLTNQVKELSREQREPDTPSAEHDANGKSPPRQGLNGASDAGEGDRPAAAGSGVGQRFGRSKGSGGQAGAQDEQDEHPWSMRLAVITFVHEAWVFLQHANILLNPLCQRLDRGYGVALLKKRLYWVIALVLAAYWARELLSMWMAARFFCPVTLKMVIVSTVYHLGKISLITLDAKRGWSPTLGIMHLLMDHWHLSSVVDLLLSLKRVALQAFDTITHAFILRDMLRWDEDQYQDRDGGLGLQRILIIVCAVWAMHAIANLVTRKSTATLVVEVAKGIVGGWGKSGGKHRRKMSYGDEGESGSFGALDGGSADFACTSSCSHGHKRCEVCHLLTRDQPPSSSRRKRVD